MSEKLPFKFIRKWRGDDGLLHFEYEASFWEGPLPPHGPGRYVRMRHKDYVSERYRMIDGKRTLVARFAANTAPNVSYWRDLEKALGVKLGRLMEYV